MTDSSVHRRNESVSRVMPHCDGSTAMTTMLRGHHMAPIPPPSFLSPAPTALYQQCPSANESRPSSNESRPSSNKRRAGRVCNNMTRDDTQ